MTRPSKHSRRSNVAEQPAKYLSFLRTVEVIKSLNDRTLIELSEVVEEEHFETGQFIIC